MAAKKILAFAASNSKHSINKKLVNFATSLLDGYDITTIIMEDYELPIFGVDREAEAGIPSKAVHFRQLIGDADGVMISFAEHNASYTAVFKNLMDWTSRLEGTLWQGKRLFFMATSTGKRGGKNVLEAAVTRAGFMDGKIVATFSLPSFKDNFDVEKGITDEGLRESFLHQLDIFKEALQSL